MRQMIRNQQVVSSILTVGSKKLQGISDIYYFSGVPFCFLKMRQNAPK